MGIREELVHPLFLISAINRHVHNLFDNNRIRIFVQNTVGCRKQQINRLFNGIKCMCVCREKVEDSSEMRNYVFFWKIWKKQQILTR